MDMEEDAQILATLLKHIPFCMNAADREHLLQDILVHQNNSGGWHIISMDGLEIAATELCSTMECPTCKCPKDELSRIDKLYHGIILPGERTISVLVLKRRVQSC